MSYSLKWYASDPSLNKGSYLSTYTKLSPSEYLAQGFTLPTGRADSTTTNPLDGAVAYGNSFTSNQLDAVTSLAPKDMALGQIVPFQLEINANNVSSTLPGIITFTADFSTKTTSGGNFGFDPNYKIIAAFVDGRDAGTVEIDSNPHQEGIQGNATVDFFSSTIVDANTSNERIRGTFQVSGIDSGENIIVEIWAVLKDNIPLGVTGNVQTRIVSAEIGDTDPDTPGIQPGTTINTGAQTVPLLRVQEFFSSSADLSVVVSDSVNASLSTNLTATNDPDPSNLKPGDTFTYTILAKNNSTDTVANTVVVTNTLDNYVTFLSASNGGTWTDNDAQPGGGQVNWNLGALSPNQNQLLTITVKVNDDAPTTSITQDLLNTVSITSITRDPNLSNNTNTEATNIVAPDPILNTTNTNTNSSPLSKGTFVVEDSGNLQFDYLFDGGWFQGQLCIFNLEGMESFQAGSKAFIKEAAQRAVSNSKQGYVVINDITEGAKFSEYLTWENDFNKGNYVGVKNFAMNPGDRFGVMLVQNTTAQEIANNVDVISQWGKQPLFSMPEANLGATQMVSVDAYGTFAMEDIRTDRSDADRDYNDMIFQMKGASGNVSSMDSLVNSQRNWKNTISGEYILNYAAGQEKSFQATLWNQGVLTTDNSGIVKVDFLYDGGMKTAEVGIFSLAGLENVQLGSRQFTELALQRAVSNSSLGQILVRDNDEGARFSANLAWEKQYNNGVYRGPKTLQLNANESYGLVLVADRTIQDELLNPSKTAFTQPLFSMSKANVDRANQFGQAYSDSNSLIVGFEDTHINNNSNIDYNDIVLGFKGMTIQNTPSLDDLVLQNYQWHHQDIGKTMIDYVTQVL